MSKFPIRLRYIVSALVLSMGLTASAQTEKQVEPILQKYQEQLKFIENKGQWRPQDLYRASTTYSTVQVMKNGLLLSVLDPAAIGAAARLENEIEEAEAHGQPAPANDIMVTQHAWMVEFVGMEPTARVSDRGQQDAYFNYFLGSDRSKWASNVHSYSEVWYNNVYNKIDCRVYTGAGNAVEYDLIAYPGADISAVQLKYTGLNGLSVNGNGELVAKTVLGDIVYPQPVAYQTIDGKNVSVKSRYTLAEGNVVGFEMGGYNKAYPVVIDPVALRWGVYISNASGAGTTGHNHGIDVDASGGIYVTGRSSAVNFPTTAGVIQTANAGSQDGFICKLNQAVNVGDAGSLAWSTYIGGTGSENIYALKLDNSGNIYITGTSAATNYPTTVGAYQTASGGGTDAVVTKVNSTGTSLLYSTYLGGASTDQANFIYVNASGEAFVAGNALTGFPTTGGAYQTTFAGGAGTGDAFFAKLNAAGSSLLYSTYYGGTGNDQFTCLRPSGTSDIVLVGVTTSAASIASVGAYKTSLVGTANNGMVVKFSVTPTFSRTWGTYINPSAAGNVVTLLCQQVDNSGNVYIGGTTNGINASAITTGAYQTAIGGGTDIYIGKLNSTGTSILAGTYVGGSGNETPLMGLNIDNFGSVYGLGYTTSTNITTTADALQSSNQGTIDALIIKMAPDLGSVKYLSYWGGTTDDTDPVGYDGIKFSNCRFYTAITTFSNNAPMSAGAYHATRTSATSVDEPAVVVWSNPPDVTSDTITGNENVCAGTPPSQGVTGTATSYVLAQINRNGAITNQTAQAITYSWEKSTDLVTWTTIAGATGQSLTSGQIGSLTVTTYFRRNIGSDFCTGGTVVTKTVTNIAAPSGSEGSGGTVCRGQSISLSVSGTVGATFDWTGPAAYTAVGASQTITNAQLVNAGNYIVTQTVGGCTSPPDTVAVAIVNCKPTAGDDTYTINEDATVTANVDSNDSDPDSDPLTYTILSGGTAATNGTLALDASGNLTYTPNANFNGSVSFTYTICDNGVPAPVLCDTATVSITINAVNDPPAIVNDNNTTPEDQPVSGTILTTDSDPDGTPLTVNTTPVSGPSHGAIVVNTNGTYTYTPDPNFNGTDVIILSVCDNGIPLPAACTNDTLTITVTPVNDPPVVVNDNNTTPEDQTVSGTILTTDNDPDGTTLTVNTTPVSGPSHGAIVVNTNGTYTYTPAPNFNGTDVIVLSVCDAGTPLPAICRNDTLTITITPVNDPPVVVNDNNTTPEDQPVSGTIITTDNDPDGTPLTVNTTPVSGPSHGAIVVNTDGTYTYTPAPNFNGTDVIVLSVCDAGIPLPAACTNDTLTITVTPVNDAPLASNDANSTSENTPASGSVTANDSDIDGPAANYTAATSPANGSVTVNTNGTYIYTPAPGFSGVDSFTYSLCDGGTPNLCDTATVVITITPVNDPPVIVNDNNSTPEDQPVSGTIITTDNDPDGTPLTVNTTPVSGPSHGAIVINPDGTYTYTPAPDFSGTDVIVVSVCDNGIPLPAACSNDTLTITITPVNDAPVANDDTKTTNEDTPVSGSVTANDSDVDGPAANYTAASIPANGTVVVNPDGTYTYTPAPNFNGVDSFTYSLCDGGTPNLCDTATVVITITPVNDPPVIVNDNNTTPEDQPVSGTILTTDNDPDGTPLTVNTTPVSGPSHGSIVINPDGTYTYTPAPNFSGTDVIVVSICDNGIPLPAACSNDTLTITITPVNDAPVANDDTKTTNEDTPVSGSVTANDSDVDGPAANYTAASTPLHGSVVVNPDGTYTYTPAANYNGVDSFIYSLCDGGTPNLCDTATVVITITPVNDPPVIVNDNNTTPEDQPVSGTILTTDNDPDGTPLTVNTTPVSGPSHGSIVINPDGTYTYTPAPNFSGTDVIVVSVCDNGIPLPAACSNDTLTITITPVNDAPVANDDTKTTNEDTPVSGSVTANDSDVDGPAANYTAASTPLHGSVVVNPDGTYTYTPVANYNGVDSFTYSLCDGGTPNLCDTATVVITITPANDPPVANNDVKTGNQDLPLTGTVTGNDSDIDGPAANYTALTTTTNGSLTFNPDGSFTYNPNPGFNGIDSFAYVLCDGGTPDLCDTATVKLIIDNVNDAPVAGDDVNTTNEDAPVSGSVTANDSDPDGPFANYTAATAPANGTVVVNPDGTYTYTPAPNFNGVDSFTYSLCDGGTPELCDTATVVITVAPVNDAPVVVNDVNTTAEDTPVSGTILTTDSDPDGTSLTVNTTPVSGPSNGTIIVNPDGTYTYTPAPNFNGTDVIVLSVCDAGIPLPAICLNDTLTITVTPVNDAPVAGDDANTTNEDTPVSGSVTTNDSDVDGPAANYTAVTAPANGTVVVNPDGTYTYTPAANFNGVDSFTYSLCDGGTPDQCDTATVVITITPVNDAPELVNDVNTTNENTPVSGTILTTDADPDGTPLTVNTTPVSGPSNGTIIMNPDGTYTYTPGAGFSGTDVVILTVCDAGTPLPASCGLDTLTITVLPVNDPPVVTNDVNTTPEDTPVSGNILANGDTDPDGTTLTATTTPVSGPAHGSIVISPDGSYTYTPAADFNGTDVVVIAVCDSGTPLPPACMNDTLVITVTPVNDAPVAVNDTFSTLEDTPVSGTVGTNDHDVDGPAATYAGITVTSNGTLLFNAAGNFAYVPNANFNGMDSFTYSRCDGGTPALCDTATVYITVVPVNDAPLAVNDTTTTAEDTPLNGTIATNDSDVDGPAASYTALTTPVHGTLTMNANGTYTYTPAADYNGVDSFTYALCDGGTPNKCDTATVYITITPVNDIPVANYDNNTTPVNTPVTGTVVTNDHDIDGPGAVYSVPVGPSHGTIVMASNGTYTYTPDSAYIGCDTMVVSLCDSATPNLCDTSLLVICVSQVNRAPVAVDDASTTQMNTPVVISVLSNDTDPDGNLGTTPTVIGGPVHGTATVNTDGTVTYTPATGYYGTDTFTYVICDNGSPALCDTAIAVVTITRPPVITAQPLVTETDSSITACLPYTLNSDSSSPAVTVSCQPAHGTVTVTIDTAAHQVCTTYTPDSGYYGLDTFCVTLCDGSTGMCTTVTVPVTVNSKNTPCYWIKGISPNDDGENDAFYINCNDSYPNATLQVFNRWGDQVWDSQGHYVNNFGGRNGRGEILPDGTYYYVYYYNDGSKGQHAGFIQVTR